MYSNAAGGVDLVTCCMRSGELGPRDMCATSIAARGEGVCVARVGQHRIVSYRIVVDVVGRVGYVIKKPTATPDSGSVSATRFLI